MELMIMVGVVLAGCIPVKNKCWQRIIFLMICLYAWVIIGCNTETPDWKSYEYMYYHIELYTSHEPGFVWLMKGCAWIGLGFQQFRIVCASFIIIFTSLTARKLSDNVNLVMSMFVIAPLLSYTAMMRQAIASTIISYVITYLVDVNEKHSIRKFLVGILIATMFHYTSVFYIVLLLCRKKVINKSVVILGVALELLSFGLISSGLAHQALIRLIPIKKITDWFDYDKVDHPHLFTVAVLVSCQILLIWALERAIVYIRKKERCRQRSYAAQSPLCRNDKSLNYILALNYLMLWLVPGYMINFNFTRLMCCVFIIDYGVLAQAAYMAVRDGLRIGETVKSLGNKAIMMASSGIILFFTEQPLLCAITDNFVIDRICDMVFKLH